MASGKNRDAYMLHYRRDNIEEDRRLDYQHEIVKHAVFAGRLIHPSVPIAEVKDAVADIGCGTGIWLNDVARTHFADRLQHDPPALVGFDVNAKAFTKNPEPGVQLFEHDCTTSFESKYHGRFDLVNIRVLAYAVPEEGFLRLVEHALRLLRPGGFLQWGESEAKIWKAYPNSPEFSRTLDIVNLERRERKLVPYLPDFMLQSLLGLNSRSWVGKTASETELVSIIRFELLPGGITRGSEDLEFKWIDALTKLMLEAAKLLLTAASIRKREPVARKDGEGSKHDSQSDLAEIEKLQRYINEMLASEQVQVGGVFPYLVARKSSTPWG